MEQEFVAGSLWKLLLDLLLLTTSTRDLNDHFWSGRARVYILDSLESSSSNDSLLEGKLRELVYAVDIRSLVVVDTLQVAVGSTGFSGR